MFATDIERSDVKEVEKFLNSGKLVDAMNKEGMGFQAMALVLQTLITTVQEWNAKFDAVDVEDRGPQEEWRTSGYFEVDED